MAIEEDECYIDGDHDPLQIFGPRIVFVLLVSRLQVNIFFAWKGTALFWVPTLVLNTILNIENHFYLYPNIAVLFLHDQGIFFPNQNWATWWKMSRIIVWWRETSPKVPVQVGDQELGRWGSLNSIDQLGTSFWEEGSLLLWPPWGLGIHTAFWPSSYPLICFPDTGGGVGCIRLKSRSKAPCLWA